MLAAAITTISPPQVVLGGENHEAIFIDVVVPRDE